MEKIQKMSCVLRGLTKVSKGLTKVSYFPNESVSMKIHQICHKKVLLSKLKAAC